MKNLSVIIIRKVFLKVEIGLWVLLIICEYLFGFVSVRCMVVKGLIQVKIVIIVSGKMICMLKIVIRIFQVRNCFC